MRIYEVGSTFLVVNSIKREYLMRIRQILYYVGIGGNILNVTYKIEWADVPKMFSHPRWGMTMPSYEDNRDMSNETLHQRMDDEDRPISPLDVKIVTNNVFSNELFEV